MSSLAKGMIGMIGLALSAIIVITVVPTPRSGSSPIKTVDGVVSELSTPCCGDVVLSLTGDRRTYYLQAALGSGPTFSEWGDRLINQTVQLEVAPFTWSEDRPEQQMVPVTKVIIGGEVFYPAAR